MRDKRNSHTRLFASLFSALAILAVIAISFLIIVLSLRGLRKISQSLSIIITEKRVLNQRIVELQTQQRIWAEQLAEYQQGQNQTLSEDYQPFNQTIAQALPIGFALGSGWGTMFINKGGADQIKKDDWVITPEHHLIGKIETVYSHYSIVKTIFDERLRVSASLGSLGSEGLFGFANGAFTVSLISLPIDKSIANTIAYTSGNDGLFPKGLILGQAISITQTSPSSLQTVSIKPLWDPPRTPIVMIVRNIFESAR
jgi:rod shape-determining protein MreC